MVEAARAYQDLTGPMYARVKLKQPKLQHYWLCSDCATHWTLISHQIKGIEMIPLRKPMGTVGGLEGVRSAMARAKPQLVPPGA